MTKLELSKRISDVTGLDVEETLRTLEVFQKEVIKALKQGDTVYMRGFGTFCNVIQKQRKGNCPSKGNYNFVVPEKNKPRFIAYNNFKRSLNLNN